MTNEKKGRSFKGWTVVALHALLIAAIVWIFISGANTGPLVARCRSCSSWPC